MTNNQPEPVNISRTISRVWFSDRDRVFRCLAGLSPNDDRVSGVRDLTAHEEQLFELASSLREYLDALVAYDYGTQTGDRGILDTAVSDCTTGIENIIWDINILEKYVAQEKGAA